MKILSYNNRVMNEGGIQVQKGMNFGIKKSYSIVLRSKIHLILGNRTIEQEYP